MVVGTEPKKKEREEEFVDRDNNVVIWGEGMEVEEGIEEINGERKKQNKEKK